MSLNKKFALCLFTLALSLSHVQAKEWRGIVPLQSTRADVERLIGSSTKPKVPVYELKNESVYIEYAVGPCQEGDTQGWNVPPDTVIYIKVSPKKEIQFADLKIDESNYKQVEDQHIGGQISYVNEDEGFSII